MKIPKSLCIIGHDHQSKDDADFQSALVRKASKREIVLGLEGVVRDDAEEKDLFKNAYDVDKGLNFGYEDDFAYAYAGVLLRYGYITNGLTDLIVSAKTQLLYELRVRHALKKAWEKLELSGTVKDLYDKINDYAEVMESFPLRDAVNIFAEAVDQFGETSDWIELYKQIALEMSKDAKELPEDLRPDFDKINAYLENPKDLDAQAYIVDELNNAWRNKFVFPHMKEIADVGVEKDLDVYLLIGKDHIPEIADGFGASYKGLIARVWNSPKFVGKEYLP